MDLLNSSLSATLIDNFFIQDNNRKKELEWEIKESAKEYEFSGKKTWIFFSGSEKMRNGSCLRGENKRQWKKNAKGNTNDISSIQFM